MLNCSIEELGRLRIFVSTEPFWKSYYNPTFSIFTFPEKVSKTLRKQIIKSIVNASFEPEIAEAVLLFPETLFLFGFIILNLREQIERADFSLLFPKVIAQERKNAFIQFMREELHPGHFRNGWLYGSRNIVYPLSLPEGLTDFPLCIRKRIESYETSLIVKRENKKRDEPKPQNPFTDQEEIHKRLYELSRQERNGTASLPRFILGDNSFQMMEFFPFPTLYEYSVRNQMTPEIRTRIDDRLTATLNFWERNLFKHNDFHYGNVLIDESLNIYVIDFDISKFCETRADFEEEYIMIVDNKVHKALWDNEISY